MWTPKRSSVAAVALEHQLDAATRELSASASAAPSIRLASSVT